MFLFCRASFHDESLLRLKYVASSLGLPPLSKQIRNSSVCNSKVSLTEFVLSKRKVSPKGDLDAAILTVADKKLLMFKNITSLHKCFNTCTSLQVTFSVLRVLLKEKLSGQS